MITGLASVSSHAFFIGRQEEKRLTQSDRDILFDVFVD